MLPTVKRGLPLYQQSQATAPAIGARVSTDEGAGRVGVVVRLDVDGSRRDCARASVCGSRQSYEERYNSGRQWA